MIATHWQVEDHEMVRFVRALVARWPFSDAAVAVAEAQRELRLGGERRHAWAAAAVYASGHQGAEKSDHDEGG